MVVFDAARLRPPALRRSAELDWVLTRSFGSPELPLGPLQHPDRAWRLANQFDVVGRVAGRVPYPLLVGELGEEVARRFTLTLLVAKRVQQRLDVALTDLAEAGAAEHVPVILLKHVALFCRGCFSAGERTACDVDVLVPTGEIVSLYRRLQTMGYAPAGGNPPGHQLPALLSQAGGIVELHRWVPGLRPLAGRGRLDAAALLRSGVLQRARECENGNQLPSDFWVPPVGFLAAHAIAHALAQAMPSPKGYVPFRVLSDLLDIDGGLASTPVEECTRWVGPLLHEKDVRALIALAGKLGNSEFDNLDVGEARLLEHFVAACCDDDYADELRAFRLRQLSDGRVRNYLARRFLFPSRSELDDLYGPSHTRLGELRQRARHPFHMLRKFMRLMSYRRATRR